MTESTAAVALFALLLFTLGAGRARADGGSVFPARTSSMATSTSSTAGWIAPLASTAGSIAPALASTASTTAAPAAERSPPVPSSVDLRFSGYVQADGVLYDQSSEDELNPSTREPLNDTRFLIRRARLRSEARYGAASAALEIDGNTVRGATARLIAAEVALALPCRTEDEDHLPLLSAALGLFKIPFGFEVQERFDRRAFIDADTASGALFPGNYDLGVKIQGAWRFLRAQLAVMNGNPVGERAFPGRDPTRAKDLVGRLGVALRAVPRVRVEAGVSALKGKGFHPGTASTKDVIVWRDVNENGLVELTELQAIAGTAGTPSSTFDHQALGADLRVRADMPVLGELFAFGELTFAKNLDRALVPADPVPLGRDVRERGFVIGLTQEILGFAQVGARYDRYNPDADARDQAGADLVPKDASFSTISVFAAWLPAKNARISLEYDRRNNALGRSASGDPARLADDALTVRGQVGF